MDTYEEQCSNFWLCKSTFFTDYRTRAAEKNLCINCDVMFGQKIIEDDHKSLYCPICLDENTDNVVIPYCNLHNVCKKCFENMAYGIYTSNEPEFPYDEKIEDDPDKFIHDPLIKKYNEEYNIYLDKIDSTKQHNCPMCRASLYKE